MLDDTRILAIVTHELQNASGGNENDFIESNRKDALGTYLGQKDGNETEGKSSVVSTDVADAIEWIMPEVMKAFTQNNEVVTFDPCKAGDEKQAELESKFVYDILMKDNEGFIVLHQFFKDALMQKNGFLKCFYHKQESESSESYTGLTEPELNMVNSNPDVEVIALTEHDGPIPTFDINVKRKDVQSQMEVCSVPPEEFRINKMHNSVSLKGARFTGHVFLKTASDLIAEGFDKDVIDSIPASNVFQDDREYRFYMQDEAVQPNRNDTLDDSMREIEVSECYMNIDIDEDGIAEYVKITVAGGEAPSAILSIEEVDECPFISSTAILMSHKLFGLSIYDRLREIQKQKTALWRNILDNMYLQNNQRTIALEGQVNLDDLLVSRPGGIIRAKRLDAVAPYATPPLPSDAYKMMDYLDQVRAGRSGVSPEGPITDSMIGDRVGSEGVAQMMSQKEELVGLMIRVFAETGIKPLCYMIRSQLIKHQDVVSDYKFRGDWVQVNPATWSKRSTSTVRVGTGSGNRQQQLGAVSQLLAFQEKIMANPGQALVKESKVFNALNDFAKFSGMPGAGSYFVDPDSEEGKAHKEQVDASNKQKQEAEMQEKKMLADAQSKIANAEESKARTAEQNVQLRHQVEQGKNQITAIKNQNDAQTKALEQQLAEAEAALKAKGNDDELTYKYWQSREQFRIQEKQIDSNNESKEEPNE